MVVEQTPRSNVPMVEDARGTAASFASQARWPVYFSFAQSNFLLVRSAIFRHAEAHIPTQPSSPLKDARLSFSHEDQERPGGAVAPSRQGAQARLRETWLSRVS